MKILLLTTHLNTGGVGVYTISLAKYLKKNGMDVAVASSGGDLKGILKEEGIAHIPLDIKTKSEFGLKMWKAIPSLTRLIKENGIDVVHAQTRVTQVLAFFAEKISGVPFVSTCHGFFRHRKIFRRLLPCWGKKAIAISKSVYKHLREDLGVSADRIELVYNGIELSKYKEITVENGSEFKESLGLDPGKTIVGTVGRLSSVKGYKYLIDAFKYALSEDDNIQLLIVGDGPERKALEQQAVDLGIAGSISFAPGGVPLERHFMAIDIFCLPSIHEGLGLSLMEAMAAGRACVASNVGGLAELIKNEEDGILVPPRDSEAVGEAITRLLKDRALRRRFAEKAKLKAHNNFSIEESVEKTIKVYEEVLGR